MSAAYFGVIDLDPGPGTYTVSSPDPKRSTYVVKLNTAGNFLWAKHFTGKWHCWGRSLALDSLKNIYIAGSFSDSTDFDPDASVSILTTPTLSQNITATNFFLAKLDSTGQFIFAKSPYSTTYSHARVILNRSGEPILFGEKDSAQVYSIFLTKYTPGGAVTWSKSMSGTSVCEWRSITTDPANNICAAGTFNGTMDFDPGPGTYYLTDGIINTLFILQLDNNGGFNWVNAIPKAFANSSITDASGSIYIVGGFDTPTDFDPSDGITLLNASFLSSYILRLNPYGGFIWVKQIDEQIPNPSMTVINDITLDRFGNLYSVGSFTGSVDFDPDAGSFNMNCSQLNAFVQKMDQSLITSLEDVSKVSGITLFPNPTISQANLLIDTELRHGTCRLLDVNGNIVMEEKNLSGNLFSFDISSCSRGIYSLEVKDDKTLMRTKLIRN